MDIEKIKELNGMLEAHRQTMRERRPEITKLIFDSVSELLGERDTDTLKLKQWGVETLGNNDCIIVTYGSYGPEGEGTPYSITLDRKKGRFTVEVETEFFNSLSNSETIRTEEAIDLLDTLWALKTYLDAGTWYINDTGTVTCTDVENESEESG